MSVKRISKRIFDLIFTIPGLLILSPLFILVSIMIKADDGGPVFFLQERVGKDGKMFRMFKFRSMYTDAEKRGGQLTIGDDPRITKTGKFLRKTKIDEIPQLINVILGDMSLVGPRPEVAKYVHLYTPEQSRILKLIPGITDPASIKYSNESELLAESDDPENLYINNFMTNKININLEYNTNATIMTDFVIIAKTIFKILK